MIKPKIAIWAPAQQRTAHALRRVRGTTPLYPFTPGRSETLVGLPLAPATRT
jgi:hypothetical protein